MKEITLNIDDDKVATFVKLLQDNDLSKFATAELPVVLDIPVYESIHTIVDKMINEQFEENIIINGDVSELFAGQNIELDGVMLPVIAAVYNEKSNTTRIILPVGSGASNLKTDEVKIL